MDSNRRLALVLLADATAVHAQQLAATARATEAARVQAEQERARERVTAEQARRRQETRSRRRRIVGQLGTLTLLAVPVWLLTPVVGSFLSVLSDNVASTVFLNGDTGDTAGSGPGTLYALLAKLLIAMIVCLGVLAFVFPYPADSEVFSAPAIGGFALGFAILLYQAFAGTGSAASWFCPPMFAILAHLTYGVYLSARQGMDVGRQSQ